MLWSFAVNKKVSNPLTNENTMNVQTLEKSFGDWIDKETENFLDTFEDRIQNAILTTIDKIITPRI